MAQVIMNGPPDCPDGRWCPVCLMDAKQKQWEMYTPEIEKAYAASGDDKPTVIPWPAALNRELFPGLYRAVNWDLQQLGLIDGLCWGHVAGTNPTKAEVPVLDTQTKLPPGLLRGKR
jgi:hypothetical protein